MEEKKTFFGELIQDLLSVFKSSFAKWIKKIWKRSVPDEIKPEVTLIVEIVERIKTFVDSRAIEFITAVIPGDKDDKAVAWLRNLLRDITFEYGLDDTPPAEYKRGDLQTIATELTARYLDMPYGQAAITVEGGFQNLVRLK